MGTMSLTGRVLRAALLGAMYLCSACGADKGEAPPPDAGEPPPADSGVCAAPKKTCSGRCVDVQTDLANCGDCGRTCAPGETCMKDVVLGGVCLVCSAPRKICGGTCVDVLANSTAHCGDCGQACTANETCRAGKCAACGTLGVECCPTAPLCSSGLKCQKDCIGGVKTCTTDPMMGTTCTCKGGYWATKCIH